MKRKPKACDKGYELPDGWRSRVFPPSFFLVAFSSLAIVRRSEYDR